MTIVNSARRLAAYALDILFLFVVFVLGVQSLVQALTGFPDVATVGANPWLLEGTVLLFASLPSWLYFTLSDWRFGGQTLGKRLLGLQTRTVAGEPVRLGQAVGRTAVKLLPWELTHLSMFVPNPMWGTAPPAVSQIIGLAIANIALVGYIALLVANGGRRTVHDFAAGTLVQPTSPSG